MADGPSKDNLLSRHMTRRGFMNVAKVGAQIATGAVLGNELTKTNFRLFPTGTTTQPEASVTPSVVLPDASPSPGEAISSTSKNVTSEKTELDQKKLNAEIAFKKHLAFYPGLLDDNIELKKLVADPTYHFNDHQLTIESNPDLYSTIYKFKLDPNAKADDIPDIQFISHENRPNLDNMLSVEFAIDHLGRIIPQMKDAPRKLSNHELKIIVGKMTQFAPEEWEDKTTFDPHLNQEVPTGIQGNNDSSIPRSYIQAQQTGRVMLALFTPKSSPRAPGIVPRPGDVLRS